MESDSSQLVRMCRVGFVSSYNTLVYGGRVGGKLWRKRARLVPWSQRQVATSRAGHIWPNRMAEIGHQFRCGMYGRLQSALIQLVAKCTSRHSEQSCHLGDVTPGMIECLLQEFTLHSFDGAIPFLEVELDLVDGCWAA